MVLDFERFAMKGNEFLHQLEANLGSEDRSHAARILRSTFRVLRNHMTPEESLHLIAQLPFAIKGAYVDGWTLRDHYRIHSIEDFIAEILDEEGKAAWRDFSSPSEILACVVAVIETLKLYVSEDELKQAFNTLPESLRNCLLNEAEQTF